MTFLSQVQSCVVKGGVYGTTTYHALVGSAVGALFGEEVLLRYLFTYWQRVHRTLRVLGGIQVRFEGNVELMDTYPLIVLPTHESALDTFVFHEFGSPAYVAKQPLFEIPFFGYCMRRSGMIPINHARPNVRQLVRDIEAALRKKRQVIFFPEGRRVSPLEGHGTVQPGTTLVVHLAERLGVPVVPASIRSGHVWGPPNTLRTARPGIVTVRFGAPLHPVGQGSMQSSRKIQHEALSRELTAAWSLLERS